MASTSTKRNAAAPKPKVYHVELNDDGTKTTTYPNGVKAYNARKSKYPVSNQRPTTYDEDRDYTKYGGKYSNRVGQKTWSNELEKAREDRYYTDTEERIKKQSMKNALTKNILHQLYGEDKQKHWYDQLK